MIARTVVCLLLAMSIQQPAARESAVVIDHLILGIDDLERGVADFERLTGVRPVFGGVHPGRGTQNALTSLGEGSYIEVIAPDPKQSVESPMVSGLKTLKTLTAVGWALRTTDLFALQARLLGREIQHSAIMPGSRALPDGSRLQWSTFGVTQPAHQWLPFFIRWADPAKQPSLTSPGGCTLESVQLEDPSPEPVVHVLNAVGFKVPVKESDRSAMTIVLKCPKGTVVFRESMAR